MIPNKGRVQTSQSATNPKVAEKTDDLPEETMTVFKYGVHGIR